MNEKVAIVTGAATGIGRATAIAYARNKAKVVLADYNEQEMKRTEELVSEAGGSAISVVTDISQEEDVRRLISETIDAFGKLDIACNNAGIAGESAMTADYSTEGWDKVMNINLKGQFLCMKYEIAEMLKRGSGSIVNVSSILGKVGYSHAPAYTAAKHGLIGLTKVAALEYSAQGIRVNAVCPGFIETPMLEKSGITTDQEIKKTVIALHPIGRLGTAIEVADAIVWLSSEEAGFITGHSLLVDGGYTAK